MTNNASPSMRWQPLHGSRSCGISRHCPLIGSVARLGVDYETTHQPSHLRRLLQPSLAAITSVPRYSRRHEATRLLFDTQQHWLLQIDSHWSSSFLYFVNSCFLYSVNSATSECCWSASHGSACMWPRYLCPSRSSFASSSFSDSVQSYSHYVPHPYPSVSCLP